MIKLDWNRDSSDFGFYRLQVTFDGQTDPIQIKSGMANVSAALHPAEGAVAHIEYTISEPSMVAAGTARWIMWPIGVVTDSQADSLLSSVTAIRAHSVGPCVLELCGS